MNPRDTAWQTLWEKPSLHPTSDDAGTAQSDEERQAMLGGDALGSRVSMC